MTSLGFGSCAVGLPHGVHHSVAVAGRRDLSVPSRSSRDALGEIGRGMLIGYIAGPAALAFFIPLYFLAAATGLI
ncbi:hypothetical protein H5P33_16120 [Mycolicibacterium arabiense]|uniref:hypothetical protein n=1 Tax=Mycolicibacterium arabiense TaxID=1286181 RepID=UPI0013D239A5|nr:hypothetical protein [Mycolicibacterium arabiense]MCV7374242.1 hypothetical protein [Mycolicibacterium arabiense]